MLILVPWVGPFWAYLILVPRRPKKKPTQQQHMKRVVGEKIVLGTKMQMVLKGT